MSSAVLSVDGRYRYHLGREWKPTGTRGTERVLFAMLNPSTADATHDDPTIRRCIGFARTWGFGGFDVVNLFALRSTDPRALLAAASPVGPSNDDYIELFAKPASLIVAAWGDGPAPRLVDPRAREVFALLRRLGKSVHHLGLTMRGSPKHPLRLRATTLPGLLVGVP